ncbi:hypothetical protein HGM15179_008599 [Zosterops borbonicus]|uniref:Uncharacterized protein n=1 Tax=Zosterops borbonicus TaxID=364589 RepID=A0A8K1GGP7_9PASS|nr:hypothetical protein HGM15179_008599 [Zosterops borbonicus]
MAVLALASEGLAIFGLILFVVLWLMHFMSIIYTQAQAPQCLVGRGPKLNAGFKVWPHQCQVRRDSHCPGPAGHAVSDINQGSIGRGLWETWQGHVQAGFDRDFQVSFFWAAFQLLCPVACQ